MNISVFLGAPGSGKGTQAKHLSGEGEFHHFSTGDRLREAVQKGTDVGNRARNYIERGELVPDSLMIEMIETALSGLTGAEKVLLDGFPRTVPQAEVLDRKDSTRVRLAIYFKMPREKLIKRLTGRRTCSACGSIFHIEFLIPKQENVCDHCSGKLIQRQDDSEKVVSRRLDIFEKQNEGLLKYYREGSNLIEINADQPIETVQNELIEIYREWYS